MMDVEVAAKKSGEAHQAVIDYRKSIGDREMTPQELAKLKRLDQKAGMYYRIYSTAKNPQYFLEPGWEVVQEDEWYNNIMLWDEDAKRHIMFAEVLKKWEAQGKTADDLRDYIDDTLRPNGEV